MFDTMVGLTTALYIILVLASQFGLSMHVCAECACCEGSYKCDSNKNCIDGCIDGYYGNKCTEECPDDCKTCVNGYVCTECKPGFYTDKCNIPCGRECANNTCLISSGDCPCKSTYFIKGRCDACSGTMYGDECNNTCPSSCGFCIFDTCLLCKSTLFYGSHCQFRCSVGCSGEGKCNKVTGHCIEECKPNYIGDKCDACSPGLYGDYCDSNCPENCFSCMSATNCTVCKSDFYGETCTNTCPSGCNGNCSLVEGRCNDCKPGFAGEFCNHTCTDGTYGVKCSKSCNDIDDNCQVCVSSESGNYGNCTTCKIGFIPFFPLDK